MALYKAPKKPFFKFSHFRKEGLKDLDSPKRWKKSQRKCKFTSGETWEEVVFPEKFCLYTFETADRKSVV